MAEHKSIQDIVKAIFSVDSASKDSVADGIRDEMRRYDSAANRAESLATSNGRDVTFTKVSDDKLRTAMEDLRELREEVGEYDGSPAGKRAASERLRRKEVELKRDFNKNTKNLNKVEKLSIEAKEALEVSKGKIIKDIETQYDREIRQFEKFADSIEKDTPKKFSTTSPLLLDFHDVEMTREDAKEVLNQFKENKKHLLEEVRSTVDEMKGKHNAVIDEVKFIRSELEEITGLKAVESAAIKEGGALAKNVEKEANLLAKGPRKFMKVGSTTVGALVGGWLGHKAIDEPGSQTGTMIGAGIGGVGGYMGSNLVAKLAGAAAHVRA